MSKDAQLPNPTPLELEILRVLWSQGPSTVREVFEQLEKERGATYYTYLKMLQIMDQKGLVRRDDSKRAHVYEAVLSAESVERRLLSDVLERCFEGSTQRLIMRALEAKRVSKKELEQIREIMDSIE